MADHPAPGNGTLNVLNSTISGMYSNASDGEVTLTGSHFHDPLNVAPIVINAICAVAFVVLTTMAWLKKGDVKGSRKAFGVVFALLIGMSLSFIRSLGEGIAHELQPRVPKAFLIVPALEPVLNNGADVTLIALIYRLIKNRNRWLRGNNVGYKTWQRIHQGMVSLLTLFAAADTALYIYAQVLLFSKVTLNKKLEKAAGSYKDVHLAYMTLYFVATLEIVGCVLFIFIRALPQKLISRILTHLLTLITPFLLIRSVVLLALTILYSFENRTEARITGVVSIALWGLPTIVIYTGIILIQYRKDWEHDIRFRREHGVARETENAYAETPYQPGFEKAVRWDQNTYAP